MDPEGLAARLEDARTRKELREIIHQGGMAIEPALVSSLRARAEQFERTDPQRALKAAEAALHVAQMLGDPACIASGAWGKANSLRSLGKYRQSLALYDKATTLFCGQGLVVESARTQIGKVDALMYLSRYDEALAAAAQAHRILIDHGEFLQAAKLDANTGNVYHRMDRYSEALSLYDRARQTFAQLGLHAFVAHVDVNRANVLTLLDGFQKAEEAYLQARATFEAAGLRATVGMIDANLGFLYSSQGRYSKAIERLNLARAAFEDLHLTKNAAVVDLDLAELYIALNLPDEAIDLAEKAHASFTDLGMNLEEARALANRAFGHIQTGQHTLAAGLLAEARSAFSQEGNEVWVATLDLHRAVLLSQPPGAEGDVPQALVMCQGAEQVFQRRGLSAKYAYAQLVEGRLREKLGQPQEAERLYSCALRSARQLHLPWLLYQAHHCLGRLVEERSPLRARRRYLLAISALESMWSDLQPEDLRTAFLTNRLQVYEDLVLLSLECGPKGVREAFQYVERAKSRALVDLLAGRLEVRIEGRGSGAVAEQLTSLHNELNWYYNRLSEGQAPAGQRRQVWAQEMAGQIAVREEQVSRIRRRLHAHGEDFASLHAARTCSLDEVQDLLDSDTTLVEYYVAGAEIVAFVIDRHRIGVERGLCSTAAASALGERLRFHLGKFAYTPAYVEAHFTHLCAAVNQHLRRLYDGLVRPLRPHFRGGRLILVPHGLLHYLPFHAFHDGSRYIVDDFEVSYSPSATVLELCRKRPVRPIRRGLVMGVPDDRAPLVAEEVGRVASLFESSVALSGEEATVAALRSQAPQSDAVHIACHGVFSPTSPMFSRFRLADAWVSVHDVYNLELDASLVTLSACETGLSRVAPGDELIGLARGFFYAGTPSLLLSLWAVNDASAVSLMQGFYRRLLSGQSKAAALRGAQLDIKQEYIHPYHWAPFILLGRGD